MLVRYAVLLILLVVSLICDIRSYRVYNLPVAAALAAGLAINLVMDGFKGLAASFIAAVLPVLVLFALYALRMLGAGDIKLFSAIGAIMGIRFIIPAMIFSFLAGGVIAIIIMLVRKNLRQRLRHIYTYLKTCFFTRTFTSYTDFSNKNDGTKFPFASAIAAGCLVQILLSNVPA